MKKTIFTFVLVLFLFSNFQVHAIKAIPTPIQVTQPDGTELTVYLRGDENHHYHTTLDGYPLQTDKNGFYTYATVDAGGNLISSNFHATDIDQRSEPVKEFLKKLAPYQGNVSITSGDRISRISPVRKSKTATTGYPLSGTPKSLVILVNFSDVSFTVSNPKTAFYNLLNQSGYSTNGGTGSARDFFHDSSSGVFSPIFDVVGPYTLPNSMSYYGSNDTDGNDSNPRQMVIDACTMAYSNGVDFAQYDTDNDGYVDNVFIYYAGYNEAEGASANTVWPHRWTLANSNTSFNGKVVYDYACTSELKGKSGANMCGVGTFCHEFGHVLGLPDLYNTDNNNTYSTLSYWDIMDSGPYLNNGRTPPSYSSYERFFLGWLTPVELTTAQNVRIDTLTASNKAYLVTQNGNSNLNGANPNPVEFFLFENRQKAGWDAYLPGHGMLITHVYYDATSWNYNTVNNTQAAMGVDIVEADGRASSTTLDGDPFPGSGNVTSYTPKLRSGTSLADKPLTYIAENNGIITFRFMGGSEFNPQIVKNGSLNLFSTAAGTPSDPQTIVVSGSYLQDDVRLTFGGDNFQMKKEGDTDWVYTLTLSPDNGTLAATNVQLRFVPSLASCFTETRNDKLNIKSTGAETVTTTIAGTYVNTRVLTSLDATQITFASFVAAWNPVDIATGYYLSVYYTDANNNTVYVTRTDGKSYNNYYTTKTTETILNLMPATTYYYVVKAKDICSTYSDNSNIVTVQTPAAPKSLVVLTNAAKTYINVVVPDTRDEVFVYDMLGQLILEKQPASNIVSLNELVNRSRNQIYLIKSGKKVLKTVF